MTPLILPDLRAAAILPQTSAPPGDAGGFAAAFLDVTDATPGAEGGGVPVDADPALPMTEPVAREAVVAAVPPGWGIASAVPRVPWSPIDGAGGGDAAPRGMPAPLAPAAEGAMPALPARSDARPLASPFAAFARGGAGPSPRTDAGGVPVAPSPDAPSDLPARAAAGGPLPAADWPAVAPRPATSAPLHFGAAMPIAPPNPLGASPDPVRAARPGSFAPPGQGAIPSPVADAPLAKGLALDGPASATMPAVQGKGPAQPSDGGAPVILTGTAAVMPLAEGPAPVARGHSVAPPAEGAAPRALAPRAVLIPSADGVATAAPGHQAVVLPASAPAPAAVAPRADLATPVLPDPPAADRAAMPEDTAASPPDAGPRPPVDRPAPGAATPVPVTRDAPAGPADAPALFAVVAPPDPDRRAEPGRDAVLPMVSPPAPMAPVTAAAVVLLRAAGLIPQGAEGAAVLDPAAVDAADWAETALPPATPGGSTSGPGPAMAAPSGPAPAVAPWTPPVAAAPDGPAELTLEAPDLGQLRLRLSPEGEGMQLLFLVERPETLDLMRRHADALLADLRAAGLSQATLAFAGWDGAPGSDRGGNPSDATPPSPPDAAPEILASPPPALRPVLPPVAGGAVLNLRL